MPSPRSILRLSILVVASHLAATAAIAEPDAKVLAAVKEQASLTAKSFPLGRYQRREFVTDEKGVPKGAGTGVGFVCIKAVAHIESLLSSPVPQGAMAMQLSQSMGGTCRQAIQVLDGNVIASEMVCDWPKPAVANKNTALQITQMRFMHSAGAVGGKEIQVLSREYRTQGGIAKMTEGDMVQLVPVAAVCEPGDETSGGLLPR
jgi:hypothetical protein